MAFYCESQIHWNTRRGTKGMTDYFSRGCKRLISECVNKKNVFEQWMPHFKQRSGVIKALHQRKPSDRSTLREMHYKFSYQTT